MKKNLLWMFALLVLAAMLAACGRGSASSQESASPNEDAAPAEALTEEAAPSEAKEDPATSAAQTDDSAPSEASAEGEAASVALAEPATADGLAIPLDSLGAEPLFVDWEQDGTPMQLIALLDGNEVRLAYNTCQSCAGSPYAYFEYADGLLTCQNCGNQFGLDSVGAVVGGCNPLPVGEASVEGDNVVIPASELKSNVPAFANWKKFA